MSGFGKNIIKKEGWKDKGSSEKRDAASEKLSASCFNVISFGCQGDKRAGPKLRP